MRSRVVSDISLMKSLCSRLNRNLLFSSERRLNYGDDPDDPLYCDVPKPCRRKSERKPYVTPVKVLIQRAKAEREARKAQPCRMLEEPPDNGFLVSELVEVAHRVYQARQSLLCGLSELVKIIPVQRCSIRASLLHLPHMAIEIWKACPASGVVLLDYLPHLRCCKEVHIGQVGHEIRTCTGPKSGFRNAMHVWGRGGVQDVVFFPKCYHLFDRVGKPRVVHDEKHTVPRIPAVIELCIQAGLDLEKYPTKRRTKPVYCIEGRIVDFETVTDGDETTRKFSCENVSSLAESCLILNKPVDEMKDLMDMMKKLVENGRNCLEQLSNEERETLKNLGTKTLNSWLEMTSGAKKIMEKYTVNTCGYCPEVQVGPKGHKVRICKASKHQSRNGLHAWQEATIDDLIGPNYVWHVHDLNGPALTNNLKRYYGKAPAVVELCVHAGAPIPDEYRSMMRLDVVPPDRDEADLVT